MLYNICTFYLYYKLTILFNKEAELKMRTYGAAFLFALFVHTLIFPFAIAQDRNVSPTLEKGIGQYKHENYDEALPTLLKAREENPDSTLAAYYLGLCYKQLQDYREAIPHLRVAVTKLPKIKGALIELIDSLYQVGEIEEARGWIKEAEDEGIRPAQTSFLKGLVLLKEGDPAAAIESFENAKGLDVSMTAACNYQIGICHLREGGLNDARDSFAQVLMIDPGSNMANFANEYMSAIDERSYRTRPFKMSAGFAWQYDDNVVLKPSEASIVEGISDQSDTREVYTAKAEYDHRFNEALGVRGQYMMYLAKQNDLGFYDVFSNTFMLQPTYYTEGALLTFPTSFNHTSVNDKMYLVSPTTSAIANLTIGKSNMLQGYVKYQYKNYQWPSSSAEEDRDGNNLDGGLGWYFFYARNKGFLNLRYGLSKEWTEGANWEYLGNRVNATLLIPALKNLNLTVSGDLNLQDYENTHSVYQVKRRDRIFTISSLLAYKFYKDSEFQLQYTFVKDSSNIDIYDYHRNIFSAGIEVKF